MKEILEKILKELTSQTKEITFQTKLMEDLFEKKDAHSAQMHEANKSMDTLKEEFAKHPALMESPVGKMIETMLATIGGK